MGDLIMEGLGPKGLERAVLKYDPSSGVRFATYAIWWVRNAMKNCLNRESTAIHIPSSALAVISKIQRAMDRLSISGSVKDFDLERIANETELPLKKVKRYIKLTKRPLSLDAPVMSEKGDMIDTLVDTIADKTDVDAIQRRQNLEVAMNGALMILDPKERNILKLRYGLNTESGQPMSLTDIAKIYNVTPERIRQTVVKARQRMRAVWRRTLLDTNLLSE